MNENVKETSIYIKYGKKVHYSVGIFENKNPKKILFFKLKKLS